jgi:hypothetical protein
MVHTTADVPFRHGLHEVWHEFQKSSLMHNIQWVSLLVSEEKTGLHMKKASPQMLVSMSDIGLAIVHGPCMMSD